jgi:hypothetical protein
MRHPGPEEHPSRGAGGMLPWWVTVLAMAVTAVLALAAGWFLSPSEGSGGNSPSGGAPPPGAPTPPTTQQDWREAEYARLARLRGGLSFAYFREILGTPLFVSRSKDGAYVQYLFHGRDYWVQAVTDAASETVLLMSITSCDASFQPPLKLSGTDIVLNKTKMDAGGRPQTVRYATAPATTNSYYYDEYYFGNPGYYKTYFLGINDACPSQGTTPDLRRPFLTADYNKKAFDPADATVAAFRTAAIANTYGESGIFFDEKLLEAFMVGADRILVRTAP